MIVSQYQNPVISPRLVRDNLARVDWPSGTMLELFLSVDKFLYYANIFSVPL